MQLASFAAGILDVFKILIPSLFYLLHHYILSLVMVTLSEF
jgi:hypothetical protein